MAAYKVLITAQYFIPVLKEYEGVFSKHGIEPLPVVAGERLSEADLLAWTDLHDIDGIIAGDDEITEVVLNKARKLKIISKWGTGTDSLRPELCKKRGIPVLNTPNAFTLPVADSVLGYILAFARRQPEMDRMMKRGQWEKIPGHSLSDCSLGVVGVGNCGKAILRRAHAFGMELLGNDIRTVEPDFVIEHGVKMVSLDTLLHRADFVSLNCDLNPGSRHLINAVTLGKMRRSAVLINCGRGPLVNEADLIFALNNGIIAGAALDVFEVEPLPEHSPLRRMGNVMLAPHNANSSPSAWKRVHENTLKNLILGLGLTP